MNGTAVMKAVDPNGHVWEYDNDSSNWIDLQTRQSLTPKEFASYASSGDAARTSLLADEMRREEAALTGQVLPPRGPSPVPASAGAQGIPAPAPVVAQNFVSPETLERVIAQRPTPSVRPPVGVQDWIQAYTKNGQFYGDKMTADMSAINRLQATIDYQRRVKAGEDSQKVLAELWPMLMNSRGAPPSTQRALHVVAGVGLVDDAGNVVRAAPRGTATRTVPGVGLVNAETGEVIRGVPVPDEDLQSLRKQEGALLMGTARAAAAGTDEGRKLEVALSQELEGVRNQIEAHKSKKAPARAMVARPEGKEIKDKDGRVWIYTGNSANPLTDRDQSHWTPK